MHRSSQSESQLGGGMVHVNQYFLGPQMGASPFASPDEVPSKSCARDKTLEKSVAPPDVEAGVTGMCRICDDVAPPCPWQCVECIEDYMAGWIPPEILEDFEGNEQTCPWDLFYEVSGEARPAAPEPPPQAPPRLSGPTNPGRTRPTRKFHPIRTR